MCLKSILKKYKLTQVKKIKAIDLNYLVQGITGAKQWFFDEKYYYTDLKSMNDIIHSQDKTNRLKYISDIRDCDDFSMIFAAHLSEYFGINSAGVVVGETKFKNWKHDSYHSWNAFIAEDKGELKLYYLEPQLDKYVEASAETLLNNRYYIPEMIFWY